MARGSPELFQNLAATVGPAEAGLPGNTCNDAEYEHSPTAGLPDQATRGGALVPLDRSVPHVMPRVGKESITYWIAPWHRSRAGRVRRGVVESGRAETPVRIRVGPSSVKPSVPYRKLWTSKL